MTAASGLPAVVTEPLGGSALSMAMQGGTIEGIGRPWPSTATEWIARVSDVRQRFTGRGWLSSLAPAFGSTADLPGIGRAAGDGVVVTTGQQAGLFGGPMLTLVKAISARALATSIERATGVPTATVFWAATDDADFAEAASVLIPGSGGARRLALSDAPPAGTPMSRATLAGLDPLVRELAASAGTSAGELLSVIRRCYRDGQTVGGAYLELMREILSPWDIAVLDASHPAVLEAGRPVNARALERAAAIERAMVDWEASLAAASLHPQVEMVAGLSLVFDNEGGVKRRIPIGDSGLAAKSSSSLSPNVLLRPVLESAILPTVSYVAGPGEIAYFAQIPPIADALDLPRPVAVPRWSTTIIEPAVSAMLERYGVNRAELRDIDTLMTRLARERVPEDARQPFGELRASVDRAVAALARPAGRVGLDHAALDGMRAQLGIKIERAERRLVAAVKRHEAELRRDIGTAGGSLFPNGVRQERALSFIPFLGRYGPALIGEMLSAASAHAAAIVDAPAEVTAAATAAG